MAKFCIMKLLLHIGKIELIASRNLIDFIYPDRTLPHRNDDKKKHIGSMLLITVA